MTQVSKYPLRREIEKRIFDLFLESIAEVQYTPDVSSLLTDLLSPTEQIMLAKRLAIAFLLYKGYQQRTIGTLLKVSLPTISKVSLALQIKGNGYRKVIEKIINREKRDAFWQKIDETLNEILPPLRRNWSEARRAQWREKLSRQKPF